jgi:hypothetical protein
MAVTMDSALNRQKKNIVKNNNKEEKKNSFLFIALSKSITTWRGELHMGI